MSLLDDSLHQQFAALIEGSNDAIIAKNLDSIILSWNRAAEHIFGYTAAEAVGQPITMLIPPERQHEEANIIGRLRRGERVENFQTMRLRKSGEVFPVSVTISPIHDASGAVVGASKIARDITAHYHAAEQQRLLLSEMKHRVGNSFAIAGGLLRLCASQTDSVDELVRLMGGRLQALAAAHSLASPGPERAADAPARTLQGLIATILEPFAGAVTTHVQVEDLPLRGEAITPLALVLYELCTNAVKYGALSQPGGSLTIASERSVDRLLIHWTETFRPETAQTPFGTGFGTAMCEMALDSQIDGRLDRQFTPTGMTVLLDLSHDRLAAPDAAAAQDVMA